MAKSTAVSKTTKSAVAASNEAAMPDFMKGHEGRGAENLGAEDVGTPRVKLIQALSPELQAYNELKAGHFFHTAAEAIFESPLRVVPIFVARRYLLWNPLESGGGILARADDGVHWSPPNSEFEVKLDKKDGGHKVVWKTAPTVRASGLAEWGSMNPDDPNSPPAATLMYEYVVGFPDRPDLPPAVFTFQRSSVKNAKNGINDKLKIGNAPSYGRVFLFETYEDQNSVGQKFFNVRPKADGWLMDQDLFHQYEQLNDMFTKSGLKVADEESLQKEGEVHDDTDAGTRY